MAKTIHRDEYVTLLRLLRQHRTAAGLTQAQCSAAMGRPQSFVSDVERGSRRLDIVQLRDLCAVLRTSFVDFVATFEKELALSSPTRASSAPTKVHKKARRPK
jgi:transcriptional regulator with XRE-family HTH domain